MIKYLKKLKLPQNPEIFFMLIVGILLQMIDGSPFSMKYKWSLVWDLELPPEYFSLVAQKIIKTILVMIIIVRCSTTYAYVVFAILVLFSLIKKTTPKLMIPWLMVAGLKSICMTFVEGIAGVYVCSAFGKIRRPCIEFFISKALEIIFAAYLWGNVLSIYQYMENKGKNEGNLSTKDELLSSFTRQRARSLLDETTLYKTACLNNFEFKDVPQIILQMLRRDDEMSEDSLLGPGMMLASVSNLGSFDSLKTSQSLGELGFMDLGTTQVVGLEEDDSLSYRDKVMRFLKLTRSDVAKIKLNKSTVENDIFTVEDEIWARVMASGTHINKPKQTRTEIFIREIPQPDETFNKIENQRKPTLKFDITFSDLLLGKPGEFQDDQDEEDSLILSQEEDEGKEDEETYRLFMSNIKEGVVIRRHGLGLGIKVMKGNRYEKLYKQDFMTKIGPEVFERATNLPKVTSFTKIMRNSVSLPDILQNNRKNNICSKETAEKTGRTSSSDLYSKNSKLFKKQILSEESLSEEEIENITEKVSTGDETLAGVSVQGKYKKTQHESTKSEGNEINTKTTNGFNIHEISNKNEKICSPPNLSVTDLEKVKEMEPCLRKRKILIKRTRETVNQCQKFFPKNSTVGTKQLISSHIPEVNAQNYQISNTVLSKEWSGHNLIDNFPSSFKKNQMHFLTEILKNPHWQVSISYFDLDKKPSSHRKSGVWAQETQQTVQFGPREAKIWKSDVLKTVEMCYMEKYPKTFASSYLNSNSNMQYVNKKRTNSLDKAMVSGSNTINYESLTPSINSTDMNIIQDLKVAKEPRQNLETFDSFASIQNTSEDLDENRIVVSTNDNEFQPSKAVIRKNGCERNAKEKKLSIVTPSGPLTKEDSFSSQESDEPISLFYSKAADLASPLLDMRRFIYPDHIHYSYKHVNKKGFDVDINGGFPLLVGENLPLSTPLNVRNESKCKSREPEIKRRPMDLSFATTNAFADWQNNYANDFDSKQNQAKKNPDRDVMKNMKAKKMKYLKKINERKEIRVSNGFIKSKSRCYGKNFNDITFMYYANDYVLIEKLLRMHMRFNKMEFMEVEKGKSEPKPIQISSTQLHSNKGCKSSMKNPAIFLRKSKNRNEKKIIDTQQERTKDMFARLASEAFLQSNNVFTLSESKRNV